LVLISTLENSVCTNGSFKIQNEVVEFGTTNDHPRRCLWREVQSTPENTPTLYQHAKSTLNDCTTRREIIIERILLDGEAIAAPGEWSQQAKANRISIIPNDKQRLCRISPDKSLLDILVVLRQREGYRVMRRSRGVTGEEEKTTIHVTQPLTVQSKETFSTEVVNRVVNMTNRIGNPDRKTINCTDNMGGQNIIIQTT